MVGQCKEPGVLNPGLKLGAALGGYALQGFDKVSLLASPEISHLPAWIEQLLAESTGKQGKGLIPVVEGPKNTVQEFGEDRHFVYLKYKKSKLNLDQRISEIEKAGLPVTTLSVNNLYDLGQEFFRWEMATAVAGSILNINPFDQPDVEASKIETKRLTSEFEKTGTLPAEKPFFTSTELDLYSDDTNIKALGVQKSVEDYFKVHFGRLKPKDYVGLLCYVEMNDAHEKILLEMKQTVQSQTQAAVCLGFGPRFLHSTGQDYKGGPNTGVFLQVTTQHKKDLEIPHQKFTFGVVQSAQARGDFQVLAARQRRVLRVHIKGDLEEGLNKIKNMLREMKRSQI